ncbi:MAG: hypothetical protein R3F44_08675 [Candidatus Competibacteraceae bacterium]
MAGWRLFHWDLPVGRSRNGYLGLRDQIDGERCCWSVAGAGPGELPPADLEITLGYAGRSRLPAGTRSPSGQPCWRV